MIGLLWFAFIMCFQLSCLHTVLYVGLISTLPLHLMRLVTWLHRHGLCFLPVACIYSSLSEFFLAHDFCLSLKPSSGSCSNAMKHLSSSFLILLEGGGWGEEWGEAGVRRKGKQLSSTSSWTCMHHVSVLSVTWLNSGKCICVTVVMNEREIILRRYPYVRED